MKVLLEHCFDHWSSRWLYRSVAFALRRRGFEVDLRRVADRADLPGYDLFLSHDFLDERDRELPRIRSWGGRVIPRPQSLELVRQAGIPVMTWSRAADLDTADALFEHWGVERLLLKKSKTMKGAGVTLFDRAHLSQLEWNADDDIFCPEIDAAGGAVYKAEIFNGRIILSFVWQRPPLNRDFDGMVGGKTGYHAPRAIVALPAELRDRVCRLSSSMTERGFAHCSLDLMKKPSGELVAIEINTGQVASWWTARFPRFHWRYAGAVAALMASAARGPRK